MGSDAPLTVLMYGGVREGATPVFNAVNLLLMVALALPALTLLRRPEPPPPAERRRWAKIAGQRLPSTDCNKHR